ncbi:hypothetical protein H310_07246 [Aphanomyces invadans]|uniref:Uncharacterized protein n=1 Tax=Aphanomyces invadans TaxID=157072 RepID=A0A024U2M1_9STRA|nr:hypothetical protein H310_07246 [Aphanomyces invadans]ETW00686.1 hypothetical protein H310_07246 [Aphanomyces invadans]|eukprot:XP_008870821.1 hypothetical protein H310_07246 [Aphanomyces invadans]
MDQSLDDVIKSKRDATKAAKRKQNAPNKTNKLDPVASFRGPKAQFAKHHHDTALDDDTLSLGTAEQLGMSLDDLLAAKRPSPKTRPVPSATQAKLRNAAVQGAQAKRQASWNHTRGLPGKPHRATGSSLTVTIRNSKDKSHRQAAGTHQRQPHTGRPASDNMLRRVNLGKRRKHRLHVADANEENNDESPPPRLQAWEQHSLEHPVRFTLPEGTNFKISIDSNRVHSVVGIDPSATSSGPGMSLRQ